MDKDRKQTRKIRENQTWTSSDLKSESSKVLPYDRKSILLSHQEKIRLLVHLKQRSDSLSDILATFSLVTLTDSDSGKAVSSELKRYFQWGTWEENVVEFGSTTIRSKDTFESNFKVGPNYFVN